MPSLHFATSVMAARMLAETGPAAGAAGWAYAGVLGFALVYLGEHYVVDLVAGPRWPSRSGGSGPRAAPAPGGGGARGAGAGEESGMSRGRRADEATRDRPAPSADAGRAAVDEMPTSRRPRRSRRHMLLGGRRLLVYGLVVLVILVALYFVLPKLAGLEDALRKIEEADPVWMAVALGFNLLSFAAYIALFRGILGGRGVPPQVRERLDWRTSYQITLAGLAATRLFSAGGAGGIALTYWALRRAGMGSPRGRPAGWSRSWCCSTRSTWARWWCAASSCGSACSPGRARSG